MSKIIGIDPGKNGGIAALDGRELMFAEDMPMVGGVVSGALLADIFDEVYGLNRSRYGPVAVVEQVHSMPKQGVASSFDFGKSYGIVLGALGAARIRTMAVTPNLWKKAMRLSADKEQARRRAIELWPERSHWFKRKRDADRAEAALIALWWVESQTKEAP